MEPNIPAGDSKNDNETRRETHDYSKPNALVLFCQTYSPHSQPVKWTAINSICLIWSLLVVGVVIAEESYGNLEAPRAYLVWCFGTAFIWTLETAMTLADTKATSTLYQKCIEGVVSLYFLGDSIRLIRTWQDPYDNVRVEVMAGVIHVVAYLYQVCVHGDWALCWPSTSKTHICMQVQEDDDSDEESSLPEIGAKSIRSFCQLYSPQSRPISWTIVNAICLSGSFLFTVRFALENESNKVESHAYTAWCFGITLAWTLETGLMLADFRKTSVFGKCLESLVAVYFWLSTIQLLMTWQGGETEGKIWGAAIHTAAYFYMLCEHGNWAGVIYDNKPPSEVHTEEQVYIPMDGP